MRAAIVSSFGQPPSCGDFREPQAQGEETLVTVKAAPLSPIVRALASGKHYASGSSDAFVPFVVGVDGVGVDPEGRRVYFLFPRAPFGSMAERSVASGALVVPVPDALGDEEAAAIATAGLASWVALTRRAPLERRGSGATVLVNGATGAAGGMAIQVARHLGASKVIAVGRNAQALARLAADATIALGPTAGAHPECADDALRAQLDAGVDVVLDFVWGDPALRVLRAATKGRGSPAGEKRLRWVQIGTAAGDEIPVRGDMLRSSGLELLGSGLGSLAVRDLVAGASELLAAAPAAGFHAPFESVPLSAISEAWNTPSDVRRLVLPTK